MTDIIAELKNARAWAEGYRDLAAFMLMYLDNVERLTPELALQLEEQIARKRPNALTLPWDEQPFPEVSFLPGPTGCGCTANGAVCEEGKRLEFEYQRAYEVYARFSGNEEHARLAWESASQAWVQHVKGA